MATNLIHRHRIAEARILKSIEKFTTKPLTADVAVRLDEALDAQLAMTTLEHALRKLATRDRDVLLLFAWTELTYNEIALALDIPVGTVRSRLNRARRAFRTEPMTTKEAQIERAHPAPDPA